MSVMPRTLPAGKLVIGYATSRSLREDRVVAACDDGVNVVIWAFAHFERGDDGALSVAPTFDVDAVRAVQRRLELSGQHVSHLVAFGGWNGPHPSTAASGCEWFAAWRAWNEAHELCFDGIDWDLEGHNDPTAPTAVFSEALLALVADFSKAAAAAGYLVALAPAESYLDASSSEFDYRANREPAAPWPASALPEGGFPYAGRNAYAHVLAACGAETFAFVSVQLYEGFSRACFALTRGDVSPAEYVSALAARLSAGVEVALPSGLASVHVPREKLVIGLANGWADGTKFLRVAPSELAAARDSLRGLMFWVIDEEGAVPPGATEPLFFAREAKAALNAATPNAEL